MKGFNEYHKSKQKEENNKHNKPSKEEIINQAFKFHSQGNISEAAKCYQSFIEQGFKDHRVFSNYGGLLKDLGRLKEAELLIRKSIQLNPKYGMSYANLGAVLLEIGRMKGAEISTRRAIELIPNYAMAHANLGAILIETSRLKEAELSVRKAIELKPDLVIAHFNLGVIFKDLGKLKEAAESLDKVVKMDPNFTNAYFILSKLIQYSNDNSSWQKELFSKNRSDINKQSKNNLINIYFARSYVLHNNKNYEESAKYLKLANQIKIDLKPSNYNFLINKSKSLFLESENNKNIIYDSKIYPQSIFIVGMLRSGSTLLESILSMNKAIYDMGEINILEESYLEYKKEDKGLTMADIYWNKVVIHNDKFNMITNKWLYNYQYAGIIANSIPNAKIIHCFRNPLDNILSIYRENFNRANEYSSSIVDCAGVYLDQDDIMSKYKTRYRSFIYDLNYDLLVANPEDEIRSLVSWLGWEWDDSYLSSHKNSRLVLTASSVQVRSPINSKSIGGWKNYRDLLKPAVEVFKKHKKFQNLYSY